MKHIISSAGISLEMYSFLLIFVALTFISKITSASAIAMSNYFSLYAIYNGTNGRDWTWPSYSLGTTWNFSSFPSVINDPCFENWYGVICDPNHFAPPQILENVTFHL